MDSSYDKTEKRIIEATLKTLYENGSAPTTSRKIAENAGLSEVTIFRRFKSKDNLLKITKQYYIDYVLEEINNIFKYDNTKNFRDLLKEMGFEILNFFKTNLIIIKVAMEDVFSKENNKIIEIISDKIIENLVEIFENAIKNNKIREINTKIAAFNIYSVIFQSIILKSIYGGEEIVDIDKKLDSFLDIFFNGIKNDLR